MRPDAKVGILVVTHGRAGEEMVATATRLLGPTTTEGIHALEIEVGEGKAHIKSRLEPAIAAADVGAGVVVACDLHGSTPTNCAIEAMHDEAVAVVCGVNLPMLVKLATATRVGTTPAQVAQAAVDTAVRSIRVERGKDHP